MFSMPVCLSGITGADVWLVAGTGPNRCCRGCSINTNTWLRTPRTTCCTAPLVSYVDPGQTEPTRASATKSERSINVPLSLSLHFSPSDNILSPPLKPPEGIFQSQHGLCVFSLLNMKILIPPLKQPPPPSLPFLVLITKRGGLMRVVGAWPSTRGPAAGAISAFHDHLLYSCADNR